MKREQLIEQLAGWIDTLLIAEMIVEHCAEIEVEPTLEACKNIWLGTLENLGGGIGLADSTGEIAHL